MAVSKRRDGYVHHTENYDGAVERLIKTATSASETRILEYNLKMAMRDRNAMVMKSLISIEKASNLTLPVQSPELNQQ